MLDVTELYVEYKITPLLAVHQLRVAAVANLINDNLETKIDKDNLIRACLLHDMGNIIKFDLDYFPEENYPQGREYWQIIKNEYIEKYGPDEHLANVAIAQELKINTRIIDLIKGFDPKLIEKIKKIGSLEEKICIYADNRVSPNGVVSVDERSLEAKKRYENHKQSFDEKQRIFFNANIKEIEKQIFSKAKIKPEDINDITVSPYIKKLRGFSI
jgi:hypothetical protein